MRTYIHMQELKRVEAERAEATKALETAMAGYDMGALRVALQALGVAERAGRARELGAVLRTDGAVVPRRAHLRRVLGALLHAEEAGGTRVARHALAHRTVVGAGGARLWVHGAGDAEVPNLRATQQSWAHGCRQATRRSAASRFDAYLTYSLPDARAGGATTGVVSGSHSDWR